jgi:hypothetical protein
MVRRAGDDALFMLQALRYNSRSRLTAPVGM